MERELAEAKKIIKAKEAEAEEERKKAAKAQAEADKKAAEAQAKADEEKQRAADAQAEADKKAAEAQAKADEEKQKAEAAKAEAEKVQTTHKAYIKRTAKERKETNEKLKTIEKEKETLRKQATKQSSSQSSSSSTPIHKVYTEIVNAVNAAYKEAIEQKKAMAPKPTTFKWKFEFNDEQNGITTLTDYNSCDQLNKLMEGGINKASYTLIPHVGASQQSYTAELTKNHGEIKQINIGTNKERILKAIAIPATQSSSSSSQVTGELSVEDKNDLMFGDAVVKLDFLKAIVDNIDKSDDDTEVIDSKELDDLADTYMSLSSNREHKNSKVFIKPAILRVWLAYAERYTHVRIVMHGAKKDAYKAIGIDRCGMDMQFGGSQGQAYGAGTYWSFSDHITHHYNVDSKPGNCILGLLLCKEQIPDHARYSGPHHPTKGAFTTMQFHHYAIPGIGAAHNACVVHETPLTLLLGQLVPK